jgi:hypothetical protein
MTEGMTMPLTTSVYGDAALLSCSSTLTPCAGHINILHTPFIEDFLLPSL